MAENFDYVIVGGGSAGCVLANRLSANPANSVCLIEAGGKANSLLNRVPVGAAAFIPGRPKISNWAFETVLPMPNNVAVGNTFNAIAGCDKTIAACMAKFNKAVNFCGEPYVPGMDKMLATAATANDLQRV